MTQYVKPGKTALDEREAALVLAGLEAGARESMANAATATRMGYALQANVLRDEAREFQALADLAKAANVSKITVQHAV